MTKRLEEIFSAIPKCKVFADIGCDHGYISKAMLDGGKCETALLADVSKKCLEKACTLNFAYIENGNALAFVADGFTGLPKSDVALIAGMGGEEIISIIKGAKNLPQTLVLQPMKNCDKVRKFLVGAGYRIDKDYVFYAEKKYYDLIVCVKGNDNLTDEEIEFGRTNLKTRSKDFTSRIQCMISTLERRVKENAVPSEIKNSAISEIERLKKYV